MPILDSSARQHILHELSGSRVAYESEQSLKAQFENIVAQFPDQIALTFQDQILTYREVNQKANRIAHHLSALGLKPGGVVATFMERGTELMTSLVAIVKMGCAYLPLDAKFPADLWLI